MPIDEDWMTLIARERKAQRDAQKRREEAAAIAAGVYRTRIGRFVQDLNRELLDAVNGWNRLAEAFPHDKVEVTSARETLFSAARVTNYSDHVVVKVDVERRQVNVAYTRPTEGAPVGVDWDIRGEGDELVLYRAEGPRTKGFAEFFDRVVGPGALPANAASADDGPKRKGAIVPAILGPFFAGMS